MSEIKTNGFGEKWVLYICRKAPVSKNIHLFCIFLLNVISILFLFLTIAVCVLKKHLIYEQDIMPLLVRVALYAGISVMCFFLSIVLFERRNFCKIIKKQEKIIADIKNK